MNKSLIEKIKEICRYFGYDLEVLPNILECVSSILLEVRQEMIKSEVKQ